ncbi:pyridoxamine 5'-phosphate oxidase family protein [Eremococcus coleocola]|uniref:Pyridoxamine 5'-phosphate oxidase family protein n=1 Tax=Eremococcus coleocola ACS-139-V-Col8 TaxID=908337 RepID=E4KP94_9LACT|nr:pyridoxamine 5'-phosphate oxidase family protein [Eremococcus coleocola]EFR31142.1 pyridoxamine 5'-phosphate oxidase family protein [Eremococcus coleocola ACS-139-V-Col8]
MELNDIMRVLKEDMKVAVFSTIDKDGKPHARHANIGVANEQGIFFMTSPKTNFYKQLQANQNIALTAMSEKDYLIQVIRIEGKVRELGKEKLKEVLKDNPYVKHVYPTAEEQASVHVFQLYEGDGFYHSLTQGHKYLFKLRNK